MKSRRPVYRAQFDFWVKPFAAAFILGVTTGVVLSFQLDTAFGGFYRETFNILVPVWKPVSSQSWCGDAKESASACIVWPPSW